MDEGITIAKASSSFWILFVKETVIPEPGTVPGINNFPLPVLQAKMVPDKTLSPAPIPSRSVSLVIMSHAGGGGVLLQI